VSIWDIIDGKIPVTPGTPVMVTDAATDRPAVPVDDQAHEFSLTGHPLPDGARWAGTCPRIRGIVWHLYDVTSCGEETR
jgi:hypothetical protein